MHATDRTSLGRLMKKKLRNLILIKLATEGSHNEIPPPEL